MPNLNKPNPTWSAQNVEDWAGEVLNPQKVLLHCGVHNYIASDTPPPPRGCKNCWEAYWWFKIASTPPHLRQERLEQAFKMVRDANQAIETGTWDFQVAEGYPEAKIEKDGFDDNTGEYRRKSIKLTDS
jgi:hypothetical protein